MAEETEIRHKGRINQTGEVFTPAWVVDEVLCKFPLSAFTVATTTFMDPAAGDGNFLEAIIRKKVECQCKVPDKDTVMIAALTTYGCELMEDNVKDARRRVVSVCLEILFPNVSPKSRHQVDLTLTKNLGSITRHNIIHADYLLYRTARLGEFVRWRNLRSKRPPGIGGLSACGDQMPVGYDDSNR